MRDLTRLERQEIKELVHQCANYDRPARICLLMDSADKPCDCPMLAVKKVGKACSYFRDALLPLNPALEAAIIYKEPVAKRKCQICGKEYVPRNNRQQYCSDKCLKSVQRNQARERKRKQRKTAG